MRANQSKKRLTEKFIDSLPFTDEPTYVWDDLPGFGLRIGKTRKTFTVIRGKRRERISLGLWPSITLQEARNRAKVLLGTPARSEASTPILEALDQYLALHCSKLKNYRQIEWNLKRHVTPISLHRVDRSYVNGILDSIRDTPGQANHFFQYFRTFMFWCVKRGYLEHYPLTGMSMPHKINSRERVLSDDEIRQVWNACGDDPFGRTVQILILTGCRRSEVQHLYVAGNMATLPAKHAKNGQEHVFPLPHMALPLFDQPLAFNGWSKAKARLDKKLNIDPWTLHDCRRTYSTIHAKIGTPLHITERLLNHLTGSISGVSAIYNRYTYQPEMRSAVDSFEKYLQSLLAQQ